MTLAGPLLSRENNVKLIELSIQYKYNLVCGNAIMKNVNEMTMVFLTGYQTSKISHFYYCRLRLRVSALPNRIVLEFASSFACGLN